MSAGSIGTPQILMLSGIGDPVALQELNIPSTVNISDVGKNLQDHPIAASYWNVSTAHTEDNILMNSQFLERCVQQWKETRTGPCTDSVINAVAFLRLKNDIGIFRNVSDPAAGIIVYVVIL